MKKNESYKLAGKMLAAMLLGIVTGLIFMAIRENAGVDSELWKSLNNLLFQDITAEGANSALGLFYLGGQLFIRSLQVIIVPMVFTSIVIAINEIKEASMLGRIAGKTIGWFLVTSFAALIMAAVVGLICYHAGLFATTVQGLEGSTGSTGANPLCIILNIIPSNAVAAFSVNNGVLAIVFLAVLVGLSMNKLSYGAEAVIYKGCKELSDIIVVALNYIVNKFGPIAIFMLLSRTFATYGITYLKPAFAYVVLCVLLLLVFLFIGYPLILAFATKMNPVYFVKKIFKVIVFGFSTSSSAATLPLNIDTNIKELGVDKQIASFVLPLGMTINMDGTAIMQVIATLFIAGCSGFDISILKLVIIMLLALIASAGTPAAPGAGAVILFTILSGVGITSESAMIAYALILAINRPIEMLVTALNCVGDSVVCIVVAKSENKLDAETYSK